MNIWLVLIAGGLFTYLTRLSFIFLMGRMEIPLWIKRSLRFVPAAVLSAIIAPELLLPMGALQVSWTNSRLLAGVVAILVAWKTKNAVLTILVGMGVLFVLQSIR